MLSRLFALAQYLVPKYLMTAIVYRVARIRVRVVKDVLIRSFLRLYDVNLEEVRDIDLTDLIVLLNFVFSRGIPPAPPFETCDFSPAAVGADLVCREYDVCPAEK